MYRNKKDGDRLSKRIGYVFKNDTLLKQALTRQSALTERLQVESVGSFQRLEFIGDRVVNMIVSDMLFEYHPEWQEGDLTAALNRFTNNKGPLAQVAENLNLGDFLIMGAGEEKINLRKNTKVLSDAFEALVGAIWIDSSHDYFFMRIFIENQFKPLGLIDFNKEYEKLTVELGRQKFKEEVSEMLDDLFAEDGFDNPFGFGGGMSVYDLCMFSSKERKRREAKQHATKPLTGLASVMEQFLEEVPSEVSANGSSLPQESKKETADCDEFEFNSKTSFLM